MRRPATYKETTYYFCSRADKEKFLSDPAKYLKR
ncbi:MAG: YHS domain-containing protein [Acidobacteria bacterium]|nr:YHS domain-containing protein [Acidobacteriota bacterium]MCA1611076.1 YHS domain-containing protein [Acidobacteriota bacterium]